jgi:hypothetical protein
MHKLTRAARAALVTACLTVIASGSALAEDDWEAAQQQERMKAEFDSLAKELPKITADAGLDTAPAVAPPWCSAIKEDLGSPTVSSVRRYIESGLQYSNTWEGLMGAAEATCVWPKQKAIAQAVQTIHQAWINITGLSAAQAMETFKLRLDKERLAADKAKLCDGMTLSDEQDGAEKSFFLAKKELLCSMMWNESGSNVPDDTVHFLETTDDPDELVRLAVVLQHASIALRNDNLNEMQLLQYVMDQYDYAKLSTEKITKILDTAPYKGNTYARAVLLESLGRAKKGIAIINGLVAKKSSDADWKELLVTAPQRGIAKWEKDAAKWKAELDRSNAFETKFWGPSRKALKGCYAELKADFLKIAKMLNTGNAINLRDNLSDPVAALLFSRLAACAAADDDKNHADRLLAMVPDMRYSRGPRTSGYWEAVSALSSILEDRAKFPVSANSFWFYANRSLYDAATRMSSESKASTYDSMGFVGDSGEGVVKSVKKVADGLEVTFVTESHKVMGQSCVDTNKIYGISSDGRIQYYQKCKDTGWITVDDTPGAITVLSDWTDGIKKGVVLEFDAARGKPPGRVGLPKAVYADKDKKKLVNWYGLGL